jgi:LysM repeat protein
MASIGRRYGLSVAQMQSANPRVNPKKIRPGQALIIPPARR